MRYDFDCFQPSHDTFFKSLLLLYVVWFGGKKISAKGVLSHSYNRYSLHIQNISLFLNCQSCHLYIITPWNIKALHSSYVVVKNVNDYFAKTSLYIVRSLQIGDVEKHLNS